MEYKHLNQYTVAGSLGYTDAWSRTLSRLGEYTSIIVRTLNMRPAQISLLAQTNVYLLVRISTPSEHLVLRIAPEGHMLCEVFFGRMMMAQQLPAARLVLYDLKRSLVPFDYTLERYVCGIGANQLNPVETPHLLRAVARQTGRVLRRMHRIQVGGWAYPTATGRWTVPDWSSVLYHLHDIFAPISVASLIFSEAEQMAMMDLLDHPLINEVRPCLMHGAISPQAVRCTVGEHIHLEALVDPAFVVAGDGLLDLAQGLDPTYPVEWRTGLLEGYVSVLPLTADEKERLHLLRLLTCYWSTCRRYALAEPHEAAYEQVLTRLAEVQCQL